MLTRWSDLNRALDDIRRHMNHVFDLGVRADQGLEADRGWPLLELHDEGSSLTLYAEIPGLGAEDINLTLSQDVLTIAGERKLEVPEGYSLRRQERGDFTFSRSFALPCPVDPERTTAVAKDGILKVTLDKAAEAQPRRITVREGGAK